MAPTWTALLVFVSVALMAFSLATLIYDWLFRYQCKVRERIAALSPSSTTDEGVSLFRDLIPGESGAAVRVTQSIRSYLVQLLDEAGVSWSLPLFAAWSLGAGIACGSAGMLHSPVAALLLGVVGLPLPLLLLWMRQRSHRRTLTRQLPEAFAMISRAVRSGQTVPSALQIIADDFDPPVSTEFALCYEQQNLGLSRETALRKLAERSGVMELQIFVVALLVQARSGGDIVELLDNLSSMIRKRLRLRDRVRALSGEGRMQALILILLPIVALIAILCLAPDYGSALIERPWLLMATGAAQLIGALWIRQIVSVEY